MNNREIQEFFSSTELHLAGNHQLREPQLHGYFAIRDHFTESDEPCFVQLPVGAGKTGLMGIAPFGLAVGRVLVLAPNLTIKTTIMRELDISDPSNFYAARQVFQPTDGPYLTELKACANIHDCDNAHFVVTNIHQFARSSKWYTKFPRNYFAMILVDEGHHNVAPSWQRLFAHFEGAKIVSLTATPVRADGQEVTGKRVYSFTYERAMMLGYISPIDAVWVKPTELQFTAKGETRTLALEEVLEMREKDWFSRGIANSEECNRDIVLASIKQLHEVRRHGNPRQIIAVACSVRHAKQIAALYKEYGMRAEVLYGEQDKKERETNEIALRSGQLDVIVQVNLLGEGYSLGTLSVAAVFRPFRTLSPYVQFIGRILRLAAPGTPFAPANRVYLVSHLGLNDQRHWSDFEQFDNEDQRFFSEYLTETEDVEVDEANGSPRLTLRPFMRVLTETVDSYLQRGYLKEIDETLVSEVVETIREKGFDISEFGLSEEMIRRRLEIAAQTEREIPAFALPVQPQRKKEALRERVYQDARSIADVVVNRTGLVHGGGDLIPVFPGRGHTNASILITLAQGAQNKVMGIKSGERDDASLEQFQSALDETAAIHDRLTSLVKSKLGLGIAKKSDNPS